MGNPPSGNSSSLSEGVLQKLRILWGPTPPVCGFERLFDTLLLSLRWLSVSYLLRKVLPEQKTNDTANPVPENAKRSGWIEVYCFLQLFLLLFLVWAKLHSVLETVLASYVLFDIYLNILNIIFLRKFPTINAPPSSVERSILLLFLNLFQVVLAFTVFYENWIGIPTLDAFFGAILVLGTIGHPVKDATHTSMYLVVALQIFLDLVLLVLVLSRFVGKLGLEERSK